MQKSKEVIYRYRYYNAVLYVDDFKKMRDLNVKPMHILIKFTSLTEPNREKNANSWIWIQKKYHLYPVFRICDIFFYIHRLVLLHIYASIFSGMCCVSFRRNNNYACPTVNAPSSIQSQVRYGAGPKLILSHEFSTVWDGTLQYVKLRSL